MCGILGINFNSEKFDSSLDMLSNRGPDYKSKISVNSSIFGHTRLSIIDLTKNATQPMIFDNLLIIFNGEIYNYKELIKSENLVCKTNSDTEILLRLYQKYGFNFLNLLNGMFSFCIYDIKKDLYFCARDRYGKKPFYYYFKDNKFIFSSLIRPIINLLDNKPDFNKIALSKYLQFFVSFGEDTFYKNIFKLEPASYIIYEPKKNKGLIKSKYYKIKMKKEIFCSENAISTTENLLFNSIELRLNSDVEIGSLLSGGLDSSLICSMYSKIYSKKINTFSIGYSDYKNYSELDYSNITAKYINSNHHEVVINKKSYIESFNEIISIFEEPHGDSSSIPLNYLTKYIKNFGIKSVFSGEGSDELFFGYDLYLKFLNYYKFKTSLSTEQLLFLNSMSLSLKNNTKESEYFRRIVKSENIYNSFGEIFNTTQKKKLFKNVPNFKYETPKNNFIDWMSYIDLKIWLGEVLLSKVDLISMNNSLEVRVPFLDYKIVDNAFKIDSNIRIGTTNKHIIKEIAIKHLPLEIINRRKKGFSSPYNEWLGEEFKDKIISTILEVNSSINLFNNDYILNLYELSKKNKFKQHIYSLFVFSLWYKKEYLS